jgi:hypothetical protein
VVLADLVKLARALADGHNLVGLCLEGAWHGDKPRLWEFGGWCAHDTPRYALDLSTSTTLAFARSFDDALASSPDDAERVLGQWFARFVAGIGDEATQQTLARRFGLLDRQTPPSR